MKEERKIHALPLRRVVNPWISAKPNSLTEKVFDKGRRERIVEGINRLEGVENVEQIADLLRACP